MVKLLCKPFPHRCAVGARPSAELTLGMDIIVTLDFPAFRFDIVYDLGPVAL
jgi:hypothetical protein